MSRGRAFSCLALLLSACAHLQPAGPPELDFDSSAVQDLLSWARSDAQALPTVWQRSPAYTLTRSWAELSGQPDPDLEVLQILTKLGETKATSGAPTPLHRIEEFLAQLEQGRSEFFARSAPLLTRYLPEGTPLHGTVLFAMFIRPFAFAWGDGRIVINLTAGQFDYQPDRVFDVLIHELFHTGYAAHQSGRSPLSAENLDQLVDGVLWQTQNEGIATYVAYRARPEALFVEDYAILEDNVAVEGLFRGLGALLNDAARARPDQLEELKSRTFTLGARDRTFYVVGAAMARQIESVFGREALIQTIKDGPVAFFESYRSSQPIFQIPTIVAAHR